ncbi:MAG: SGNH/GDSL hydrolase family protein [Prevotellaceae bacterium]|jgi:hypothetical protein|nr:SGNH/GDSL hydrolase family protein [Prevotellaceae bacterium]
MPMMHKNYLTHTLLWTLLVLTGLLFLHYLPPLRLEGHALRQVDLLSDVRLPHPSAVPVENDSLPLLPTVPPKAFVDTCRTGMTCIEDYSDSTARGMEPFYRALAELEVRERNVRIAYFGDSFIEADILTADLRRLLQERFGGSGVGYVDITSQTYGYRPTVRHRFEGWNSHAITDSAHFDARKQGISNHYFVPRATAFAEYSGQSKYASRLDTVQQASIYFYTQGEVTISATVNQQGKQTRTFYAAGDLQEMEVNGDIGSVRWSVDQADSTLFYGVTMDDTSGISVDNFALRGSSGLSLASVPMQWIEDFNRERPYDLLILQYGLNVATEYGRNYDKYRAGMNVAIAHLKKAFPQAGILLVSVGDRDYRTDEGTLRTMPGIRNLVRYQQEIAATNAIAFWNLWQAMGGEGSMAKLVEAKPAMANLDYTHINFRGGRHLAGLMYGTLMYGKAQYDRRQGHAQE